MNQKKITTFLLALCLLTAYLTSFGQSGNTYFNANKLAYSVGSVNMEAKDSDGDGVKDRKDECPDTPSGVTVDSKGCPVDTDRDGVVDYLDKCPQIPGTTEMNGCQDKDKDGVADNEDSCPEVPGIGRFKGCPDSDADGVEDSKDKCPNQIGLDMFMGCPDTDGDGIEDSQDKCADSPKGIKVDAAGCPSDTDGDGILDSEDKCPSVSGDATNSGCPVMKADVKKRLQFAARGITFETGKATLTTTSYPMLDEVISILNEYEDYNLRMGGHTDAVGKDSANLSLSQSRVDAVKAYLIGKGVSDGRIEATGFGETRSVGSNATEIGRAKNRRVELELFLK